MRVKEERDKGYSRKRIYEKKRKKRRGKRK